MKAIVYTQYGPLDVLQFTEVEKPLPQDHDVLIKVQAASVNTSDGYLLRGPLQIRLIGGGPRKPKDQRLGTDLAGRVEAVDSNSHSFSPEMKSLGEEMARLPTRLRRSGIWKGDTPEEKSSSRWTRVTHNNLCQMI